MTDPRPFRDEIQRMWQEAEVYESQGLYDHAVLVYQNILVKEPDNKRAQAKVIQIQFNQRIEDQQTTRHSATDEFSPRLALDLGLAYMGMNLYSEALGEFEKGLENAPASDRVELLRYKTSCLFRLRRFDHARNSLDGIVNDWEIAPDQKADIIEEMVGICIEEGLMAEARDLLVDVPTEVKAFIGDYDLVVREVESAGAEKHDFEMVVEDTKTGEVYGAQRSRGAASQEQESTSGVSGTPTDRSIPLNAAITYSFDNKTWHDGIASRLCADWALLRLPDSVEVGDSLVLKIHLPSKIADEPVWVVSRIARSPLHESQDAQDEAKAQFVSFLPGGEAILKNFIDEVVKDPSILAETPTLEHINERNAADRQTEQAFAALQAEAAKAMEIAALSEPAAERAEPESDDTSERQAARAPVSIPRAHRKQIPKIRFACQCGQVHVVPMQHVGRKGTCGGCGEAITVPVVDPRQDSLSEQMIGITVGGCILLYKIGGGGMGGVYKAHHLALDVAVAVKLLHSHLAEKDPIFIRRFIREARSAAKLQHPNIVGVMNVGFEKGVHFLVMPYVGGGSAAALLAKIGRLPLAKVLQIGIEITRALNVAEENRMLHRDIKPANILFNTRGEAMLADLGLAKHYLETQDAGITQTGITCGTPLYFSPEQAKGSQHLDIRSDIYSLGITLYHLLTGSPPFIGESAYVIFQKHVHDPLPPFKEGINIPLTEEVFQILFKMTTKKPEDRFQDSRELLQALEELRRELSEQSKPPVREHQKKGLLERLGIKKPG
jgi:tetratricopeptide (TPR) repeat protein